MLPDCAVVLALSAVAGNDLNGRSGDLVTPTVGFEKNVELLKMLAGLSAKLVKPAVDLCSANGNCPIPVVSRCRNKLCKPIPFAFKGSFFMQHGIKARLHLLVLLHFGDEWRTFLSRRIGQPDFFAIFLDDPTDADRVDKFDSDDCWLGSQSR